MTAHQQAQSVDRYSSEVEAIGPANRAEVVRAAMAYNDQITGGIATLAANERFPTAEDSTAAARYQQQLDADEDGLMARIRIPAINVDLPIYHGTSESVLEQGVGHLEGTSLPVGGADTHAVLTGHRGLATSELFTRLNELHDGNRFTIEVFGKVLTYRIIKTEVVAPADTQTLRPVPGRDLLTLVTCTPLFINSQRILVTGERVLPTPPRDTANGGTAAGSSTTPWWVIEAAFVVSLLTLYVWRQGRPVGVQTSRSNRGERHRSGANRPAACSRASATVRRL
jgi:sortase A